MNSYGITKRVSACTAIDLYLESLSIKGFCLVKNILSENVCDHLIALLKEVYNEQESSFGKDNLDKIKEADMVRMPFLYRKDFFALFTNDLVLELAQKVLGEVFTLHLQNGIINQPKKVHHQTSWHRDLPYQDWVISKPLAFNAFYCLTDFTSENGATFVLPHSHRIDYFPSEQYVKENELQIIATKGSVIFFDSMLYHRAGVNLSSELRIGVNNMFVVPILRQQIDIGDHFKNDNFDSQTASILGIPYQTPVSVDDFRYRRLLKLK